MIFDKIFPHFIEVDKGKVLLREREIPADPFVTMLDSRLCNDSKEGFHKWFGYLKEVPTDDEKFSGKLIGEYFVQPRADKKVRKKGLPETYKPGKAKSLKFEILF